MAKRNIIVMGASSGGLEAFKRLIGYLPPDLDAAIFIVWHMSPSARGMLPEILSKVTTIPTGQAYDREPIQTNRIYVAPPDHHMLLEENHIRVTHGPKENRFRPAIDPLFRSAAYVFGSRVMGVVLTGALDDGTSGLWTIKQRGGLALVQDPYEAELSAMPESAIREVAVDFVLPLTRLAQVLAKRAQEDVSERDTITVSEFENRKTEAEIRIAEEDNALEMNVFQFGELSPYTCPECHGVLTMLREGSLARFRCHTGHAYSVDTLLTEVTETIEDSLYNAVRSLDEGIILLNHLGDHYAEVNQPRLAALYFRKAKEAQDRANLIRQATQSHEPLSQDLLIRQSEVTGNTDL